MSDQRAIIYVPAGDESLKWQRRCLEHVESRHYELVSLVVDEDGERWAGVRAMLDSGTADVVVVAKMDHPPRDRTPRMEVAGDEPAPLQRRRRPALINRSEEG